MSPAPSIPAASGPGYELDDDHRDFQEVCRAFVDREVRPLVREAERSQTFPAQLWPAMAAAGLLGVGHPEEHGGTGGGVLALTILSEELGRSCGGIAITPLVSSYMAAPHLARFGTDEQQRTWLAPVLAGEHVAAIAVTEPGAGSDVAGIQATARSADGGWTLHGTKMFITNAGLADVIIVAARTEAGGERRHAGISTFLVRRGAEGMSMGRPLEKMGWHSSDTREVHFDGCFVGEDRLLGGEGRGFQQIMEAFQVERVLLAGMGLGLAEEAIADTVAHMRARSAFGGPIGRMQALRHRVAEMRAAVDAARLVTYQAAARCDAGHPGAGTSVAMAKLVAARVACEVVDEAVQLFGGYGFIEETPIAMHYRDARILRIGGGTDEVQLEIIAKRMDL
ncbi:acyl-CoA dehydrogenase [Baekduia soli]|uniref:Medium-chain specific acyl-CoA dehydrogenase, mitochondrial n=1 Tax=Baekduia soli TaxID=496014 RepID=A0A5B8U0H3_9ACTN|nr:acyl-CoA dehydrogenase family protein [Baekduia soli]QEC46487.1 acyl-CoA dehydrogenase [Baekduia soli]